MSFPILLRACARAVFVFAAGLGAAQASDWPARPIRLVACFPPGNAADVLARSVQPILSQRLGQPVVVDNRGGAGGVIGVDAVVKSAPDGYTIGVCSLSPLTIMPAARKKLPYDPGRDIAPVILISKGPMIAVVKKDSPFNTLDDLIRFAKANPDRLTYGSLGIGTISQMSTEAFKAAAGIDLREINYKGSSQALTDLIGGQVDFMLDGAASAAAQLAAGNVKALAVTTRQRVQVAPNVPAMDELGIAGLKGFDVFGWVGVFAPADTPADIVSRFNREFAHALKEAQVVRAASTAGQEIPAANTPEQFRDFIQADFARWSALARQFNIEIKD